MPNVESRPRPAWASPEWKGGDSFLPDLSLPAVAWAEGGAARRAAAPRRLRGLPLPSLALLGVAAGALLYTLVCLWRAFLLPDGQGVAVALDTLPEFVAAFLILVLGACAFALFDAAAPDDLEP